MNKKLIDVIQKLILSQLLLLIDSKLINILIISIIIIYNLTNILKILQKNGLLIFSFIIVSNRIQKIANYKISTTF